MFILPKEQKAGDLARSQPRVATRDNSDDEGTMCGQVEQG
jgi:hypothetical protein